MTMTKLHHGVFVAILIACSLIFSTANGQGDVEFSEAETRLWMTDQLSAVTKPTTLRYRFEKSGTLEAGFSDEITFDVKAVNADGTKAATLNFFSGERNFPVPPVERTTVNPILKVYLQGDVYEMNRLSDPEGTARERWRYFQRRIKFALAQSASVEPHQFNFGGRQWDGHRISFQPYVNDPKRNQFERYADKQYTFIVCDDLPGYLYQIETTIPGESDQGPLIREQLQLQEILPES